ncbi:uncharacterized protein LOC122275879 [Carya illinoinensis]|uniref:uncharacterized protein LOC122275879 n=1 Tax=Carya illinoinensis TaxID=32201 RepID=UPI001C71D1F6|nr:uncharacterized protein LOC122275879 [Carya illinoinensis]
MYHYIEDLVPEDGHPSYLQLYFFDTEHELENCIHDAERLDPSIIARLMDILEVNPYCRFFRTLSNISSLENHTIRIRSDIDLDQRVYNAPSVSQVAAIWTKTDNCTEQKGRDIIVFNEAGGSHIVQGPRDMQKRYMEAMTLVQRFDKPDIFLTMTFKAVKYLYKYIYKGYDRVAFNIISKENNQQIDEIEQFQSGKWITPPEAMWRIYDFTLNEIYPSVYSLHLHLEDQHLVSFHAHEDLNNVLNSYTSKKSMLSEFFYRNQIDENARKLLYREFPEKFVWDSQCRIWTPRKKKTVIGRIVTANPFEGERYYLRMLLNHIRGVTSFEKLRTVNGVVLPMYREAATSHGLLNKASSLEDCLEEACLNQIPSSLRHLFSTILVYCNPTNPKKLWERFEKEMYTDFLIRNVSSTVVRKMVLQDIASTLESMGKDINMYRFVPVDIFYGQDEFTNEKLTTNE